MKNLKRLDLKGVDLTDHGLPNLAGLTQLETLDLSYGRFSAAGLKSLTGLQQLKSLGVTQFMHEDYRGDLSEYQ